MLTINRPSSEPFIVSRRTSDSSYPLWPWDLRWLTSAGSYRGFGSDATTLLSEILTTRWLAGIAPWYCEIYFTRNSATLNDLKLIQANRSLII